MVPVSISCLIKCHGYVRCHHGGNYTIFATSSQCIIIFKGKETKKKKSFLEDIQEDPQRVAGKKMNGRMGVDRVMAEDTEAARFN